MTTIPDDAVEAAVALLEERGWERDEEMVADVRDALAAAHPRIEAAAAGALRRRRIGERARRVAEQRREERWRYVPPEGRPG